MTTAVVAIKSPPEIDYDRELRGMGMLLKSGLLPVAIKTPEAALFIVLTGRDLGMSPVQSLRSIYVIQGKVEVSADAQLGLFHKAGGKSAWITLTDEAATLELRAPWLLQPHRETFTLANARTAKLGGDNWTKYPKAMLRSRAITAGLKSIGFDATSGMYAPGELTGAEAVDLVTGEVTAAPETVAEPLATDKQHELLAKMLKRHVWTEEERLGWLQQTGPTLTKADATTYIDELMAEGTRRAQVEKDLALDKAVAGDEQFA